MSRGAMFGALLTLLDNAAKINDYYNQIKVISQKILNLEWLLTPIQFTPITYFDPTVHRIDEQARIYLEKGCLGIQNKVPIEVFADGNCLYHSIICLNGGRDLTVSELRVRTLLELVKNDTFYHNRFLYVVGSLLDAVKSVVHNSSYSELYEIAALCNVLKCNIQSVYPKIQHRSELDIMNSIFQCDQNSSVSRTIFIFWSNTQSEIYARSCNAGHWSPNHFVPLLALPDDKTLESGFSSPDNALSNTTPTKATTKNNLLTPVRIPHFTDHENRTEILSALSTDSIESNQDAVLHKIKRTDYHGDNRKTTKADRVENPRTITREKNPTEETTMVLEKVGRQRVLARERSAARRAALSPAQIERQRTLDRERKVATRAAMAPEEIEHQRALARERSMNKRAVASPAESETQRALARERSSARRVTVASESAKQLETSGEELNRAQENVNRKTAATHAKTDSVEVEWPKPVDLECKITCLKNFIQSMSMNSLEEGICSICNIRCYKRDLRCIPYNKIPSIELLKAHDDIYNIICGLDQSQDLHSADQNSMDCGLELSTDRFKQSSETKASFICVNGIVLYRKGLHHNFDRRKRSVVHCDICMECWSSLTKEKIPKFSVANKVWVGDVPPELQGLTIPEQRLIALYRHNSCIVKLHSSFHSASTAQAALKGNCISFPQDVVNIATSLPLKLDDLCDSLKIIFVGSRIPNKNQLKRILTVRKTKVAAALQWLKTNNSLYRHVTINKCTIENLPDDDVPECLWTTMQISTEVDAAGNDRAGYVPDTNPVETDLNNDKTIPLLTSGVLDVNGINISSDDVTQHMLERVKVRTPEELFDRDSEASVRKDPVYLIPRGNKPTNEYYNPNLLMGIFPTLFPYGCGALEDNSRSVKINLREHIRYLL
ncbi:unnamed protein product, partial [Adineta ricciae]